MASPDKSRRDPLPAKLCRYPACGIEFTPKRTDQVYHSKKCRMRHWVETNRPRLTNKEGKRVKNPMAVGLANIRWAKRGKQS
jgi:hypothetical protein